MAGWRTGYQGNAFANMPPFGGMQSNYGTDFYRGGGGNRYNQPGPRNDRRYQDNRSNRRDSHTSRPRYEAKIPNAAIDKKEVNASSLKKRFSKLYVPSDFFHCDLHWQDCFPMQEPFKLGEKSKFHIVQKEAEPLEKLDDETTRKNLDPEDADYTYSAKVMLLAQPNFADLYKNTIRTADETMETIKDKVPLAKELQFLVGTKNKTEVMPIGGPWSPSLDGKDVEDDPLVLIKTAIRTTKALTGIDLSSCTRWYRFMELHYYRPAERVQAESAAAAADGDKTDEPVCLEPRVENVVIFVPSIGDLIPTKSEWSFLQDTIKKSVERRVYPDRVVSDDPMEEKSADTSAVAMDAETSTPSKSELESLKVDELRRRLSDRGLESKGVKANLIQRLLSSFEEEAESRNTSQVDAEPAVKESKEDEEVTEEKTDTSAEIDEEKEKQRKVYEQEYRLGDMKDDDPCIMVHPSASARNGKFGCSVMSLQSLLSYRVDDQKEHMFEVSLFAEQFNDMLYRDAIFDIYRATRNYADVIDAKKAAEDETDEGPSKPKQAKRTILRTNKPNLLLHFTMIDVNRVEFIRDTDMEAMFHTLGFFMSRAQVRSLIHKVIPSKKDSLRYRNMTDNEVEEMTDDDVVRFKNSLVEEEPLNDSTTVCGNKMSVEEVETIKVPVSYTSLKLGGNAQVAKRLSLVARDYDAEQKNMLKEFQSTCNELQRLRSNLHATQDAKEEMRNANDELRLKLTAARSEYRDLQGKSRAYNRIMKTSQDHLKRCLDEVDRQFNREKEAQEKLLAEKNEAEGKKEEEDVKDVEMKE